MSQTPSHLPLRLHRNAYVTRDQEAQRWLAGDHRPSNLQHRSEH